MKNFDIAKATGVSINRMKQREWSQDFVPEIKIENGIVVREDQNKKKHYIKVIELNAVNFMIMTPQEQDNLIEAYSEALRTFPDNFHIKITTTYTDISEYIKKAEDAWYQEKNDACREMIENYIHFLSTEASTGTLRNHYYFIFEFENSMIGRSPSSESEIADALNKMADNIISKFEGFGNRIEITHFQDEDVALANLIYDHYNKFICAKETLKDRTNRLVHDYKIVNGLSEDAPNPDADFKSMFAPKNIDFNESPNYMLIDGLYRSHFYIPGISIPGNVSTTSGWFPAISKFGEGFEVDLFFARGDKDAKIRSLRNKITEKEGEASHVDRTSVSYKEKTGAYQDAIYIKDGLMDYDEEIYEMSVLISTSSATLEDLRERKRFLKKRATELKIRIVECRRFQEEAFFCTGFGVSTTPKIYNLTHRNVLSSAVATMYPFTSFLMRDPEGIALGYNLDNRSQIMVDWFSKNLSNANICIYGGSGAGKTFTILTNTSRQRCLGDQQYIIAPEKQHEFIPTCQAYGGQFADISPSSPHRINLFDIYPQDAPDLDLIEDGLFIEKSWLIEKVNSIKMFCSYLIPDLTLAEKVQLEKAALSMYEDFGITEDNYSIYKNERYGDLKEMPIMSDFYDRVCRNENLREDVKIILSQFIDGAAKSMNGHTNIDLNNKFLVFGVENIKGDLLAPCMFIILDYILGKSRENITKKKTIIIDEFWKMIDKRNPAVMDFMIEQTKLIRGYGGQTIYATQSVQDLFRAGGDFGNTILSCSYSKIILGMESKDIKLISEEVGLTPVEAAKIEKYKKGKALLCAGPNHIPIQVKASEKEAELFETERSEREKILQRKKRKREEDGQIA